MAEIRVPHGVGWSGAAASGCPKDEDGRWHGYIEIPDEWLIDAGWQRAAGFEMEDGK